MKRLPRLFPLQWGAVLVALSLLTACGSSAPVPDWKRQAQMASEQASQAYLAARDAVAQAELAVAREEASSTGAARWLAQVELTQCALQVASLDPQPCLGFAPLSEDALPEQQAYARYLAGVPLSIADVALLPPLHQPMAQVGRSEDALLALPPVSQPQARLIAAGVALRSGHASKPLGVLAVETAEAQGWRRPLLAWLGWLRDQHVHSGERIEAERLQRRMDWIVQKGQPAVLTPAHEKSAK